ncbi:MAG: hypothetical protein FJX71_02875 [Alphaproteobacteria bacterium]|nr:hypothetical protein [Alphaproteobacteria bacterium]
MENMLNVILTGTPSDSHTWNLIFMELFLQENKCRVRNLGSCVSAEQLHTAIEEEVPDLVVISSINGHLFQDAIKIINTFPSHLASSLPPLVVGGKMGITLKETGFQGKKLLKLGYSGVFVEKDSLVSFKQYLHRLGNAKSYQKSLRYAV